MDETTSLVCYFRPRVDLMINTVFECNKQARFIYKELIIKMAQRGSFFYQDDKRQLTLGLLINNFQF